MWSHGPPIGELFHLDDNSTWGLRCENCFNHYNGTGFWSGTVFKPFGKSDQRACAGKCTCELASLMRIGCKCGGK